MKQVNIHKLLKSAYGLVIPQNVKVVAIHGTGTACKPYSWNTSLFYPTECNWGPYVQVTFRQGKKNFIYKNLVIDDYLEDNIQVFNNKLNTVL